MAVSLGRVILYARNLQEMADFYTGHFGFRVVSADPADRLVELVPEQGGATILLHAAAAGQRQGQVQAKLVFDVEDVALFCKQAAERGLVFGPVHRAEGYSFANTKDPSGNAIQVSGRAFVPRTTRQA